MELGPTSKVDALNKLENDIVPAPEDGRDNVIEVTVCIVPLAVAADVSSAEELLELELEMELRLEISILVREGFEPLDDIDNELEVAVELKESVGEMNDDVLAEDEDKLVLDDNDVLETEEFKKLLDNELKAGTSPAMGGERTLESVLPMF